MKLRKIKLFLITVLAGGFLCGNAKAAVTFGSPTSATTTAVFDSTGTYTLQLSVTDGAKTTAKTTVVTVNTSVVMPKACGGTSSVIAGNGVDYLVAFGTGSTDVSAFQFDVTLPAGITFNTVTAGPVLTTSGKGVSANMVGNALRVLISGLNQTPIGTGLAVTINLRASATLTTGQLPLTMSNVSASDPAGSAVIMTSCNGILNVTANQPPTLILSPNQTILLPASANLVGTASDDGAPNPPSALSYTWSVVSIL